ncbi:hypothetical protein WALSEDRAFT_58979 [Wallemia mellicola CBS 633.66]|uniref:Uncharacterized protein n=1 Tax=Wallemia mellicola (strain ATCC MYA-4683 / CBS 633.66) TaxID=671144 RepID=I4YIR8_WALMC|nr:hypothetical protein WALSEDRAFT_58979 [Wallemia mellicola CBS 633.66]EIM23860.1 hypothetical protein WALSEDRAFT_58979 [Wallemia mellicola CBS 633.66]|eukprot:XP_006955704.1 hypothetical protein WALSEDRAFT_58979 [Wallemia mellicola CBS 633.66]
MVVIELHYGVKTKMLMRHKRLMVMPPSLLDVVLITRNYKKYVNTYLFSFMMHCYRYLTYEIWEYGAQINCELRPFINGVPLKRQ